MSYEESLRSVSLNADSSLAGYTGVPGLPGSAKPNYGKQYRFVKVTGENTVGLATSSSDDVIGINQGKPQVTGQAATVGIRGISNVMSGGKFAAGDKLTADSEGRAVKATGDSSFAVALQGAEAAGHLVPALIRVN